jgi:microcystin-dependent protein
MDPYIGEIRLFSFDGIPRGWVPCEGQLLPIQQNQALFSLLGTTYGGNGVNNFALPDLRGRVPVHADGTNPLGTATGAATHTLTTNEIPAHTHAVRASTATASSPNLTGNVWAQEANAFGPAASLAAMSGTAISKAGGSQPHDNMQPYLAVSFYIATQGLYPTRS